MIRKCALVAVMLPTFTASQAVADSLPESGKYLVTFKTSETWMIAREPEKKQNTKTRLIAFQGNKILVSTDEETGRSNSHFGTVHTGPGRKCETLSNQVGCNSISINGNSLVVKSTVNVSDGLMFQTINYTVSFDGGGCKVRSASFAMKSTSIFKGSSGKLISSSCSKQ